jgi:hypothetical protein
VLGGDCRLGGIDLDTCRDPKTETIEVWAQQVINRFATYTEISPSRTGVKLFFRYASSDTPAIKKLFDGKCGRQFKNGGGGEHPPAIEIYYTGRYFTTTEESIGPTDIIRQVPIDDIEWVLREAGPAFAHKESQNNGSGNDQSRSGKAFRKGATLKASGYTYDAMRDALLADADPEIVEWARTKGSANGERELHRIYDNAGNAGARPNGDAGPWPDPQLLPCGLLPVDEFDPDFLPDAIAPWIMDIADRMQCPPDFVAIPAIVALGSVIGRKISVRPQRKTDWYEVPNLWGCIVGRPGALKSPAMKEALNPLTRLEIKAGDENEANKKIYATRVEFHKLQKEDAQKRARRSIADGGADASSLDIDAPEEPKAKRYIVNDTSYEAGIEQPTCRGRPGAG